MLRTSIFIFMPAPGPHRRLASESFRKFSAEVFALLRRRQVLIELLFSPPCGTFALVNILYGVGNDFNASPRRSVCSWNRRSVRRNVRYDAVSEGRQVHSPAPSLCDNRRGRWFFTLALILLPRTSGTFALVLIDENMFQALAITCSVAIAFETIGPNNPLAATTFAILTHLQFADCLYADGRRLGL